MEIQNEVHISVRSLLTVLQHSAQLWVALFMNKLKRLWKENGENISEVRIAFISFSGTFKAILKSKSKISLCLHVNFDKGNVYRIEIFWQKRFLENVQKINIFVVI